MPSRAIAFVLLASLAAAAVGWAVRRRRFALATGFGTHFAYLLFAIARA